MFQRFRTTIWSIVAPLTLSAGFAIAADAPKADAKPDETKTSPAEEPKIIKPEEAKDYVDKVVTVEFTVLNSKQSLDKNIGFLNSEKDIKSPTNFTAYLSGKGLKKFKQEGKIEKPAEHFLKKKVRVTGEVVKYKEKLEIVIDSPEQIKIVEEEKDTESQKPSSEKPPKT